MLSWQLIENKLMYKNVKNCNKSKAELKKTNKNGTNAYNYHM